MHFKPLGLAVACLLSLLGPGVIAQSAGPFGIHVRTEPLAHTAPGQDPFVPGHEVATSAGAIRTVPELDRIEFVARGGSGGRPLVTEVPPRSPSGVAASDSFLWVADTGNRRILRWALDGGVPDPTSVSVLDTPLLRRPVGLATDGSLLFVADSWSDQILVLDESGSLIRTIGQHGSQPGFLSGPIGLLLHDGLLYVADSRNSRVQAFDPDNGLFDSEGGLHVIRPHEGEGRLHYPTKLLVLADGTEIGVTEPWEDRVQWFRRAGDAETVAERLPLGADNFVHFGAGVDTYDRLFAVTDPDTHTVRVFDLSLDVPVLIGVIGDYGDLPSQFVHPSDVAFVPPAEGRPLRLAVADRGNARIALFAIDWSPDESLRFRPTLASLLRTLDLWALRADSSHPPDATALIAMTDGTISLLDAANQEVIRLNQRLRIIEEQSLDPEDAKRPSRWITATLSPEGDVVALDGANSILLQLQPGGPVTTRLAPAISSPSDIRFVDEELLVVDGRLHTIARLNETGEATEFIGRRGLGAGEFFKPAAIATLADGRKLVIDRGNHRAQFFGDDWSLSMIDGPRLYIATARPGGTARTSPTPPQPIGPKTD